MRISTRFCCIHGTQGQAAGGPRLRNQEVNSMSNGPNLPQAIEEAAGYVRDTIKHFTDDERKKVLDRALRELSSKLVVHDGS
jgi:hypothetical protein